MVPLCADFTGQFKSVYDCFLSRFNLSQSLSSLKSQLKVIRKDFEDLFIRYLESHKLIGFLIES
jgi:hypothetical protein